MPAIKSANLSKVSSVVAFCFLGSEPDSDPEPFAEGDIPHETKHPILLPPGGPSMMLLLQDAHDRLFHAGPQEVLAEVRKLFWIIRGRKAAQRRVNHCFVCRRLKARLSFAPIAPLPADRVTQELLRSYGGKSLKWFAQWNGPKVKLQKVEKSTFSNFGFSMGNPNSSSGSRWPGCGQKLTRFPHSEKSAQNIALRIPPNSLSCSASFTWSLTLI
uniref:Integrase zinc-binding domain-containing protein n=1 Tax=Strigamia maritima TaxID=126957 RepID=T1IRB7_STRMM